MFNYSVILGNVGQCADRYMGCGYGRGFEIEELFERVASIEGVKGVELVGNWHISDKNVHQIKELSAKYGLPVVAIIPDHFGTPIWGKGAFTAPDPKVRKQAVQETLLVGNIAKELDCPLISIWNGQDGYDYPFQANYVETTKWLKDGVGTCCREMPDMRFSLEYKPKEPRTRSFVSNVWSSLTMISEIGVENLGITIDVGHSFEAYENVAEAAVAASLRGKLFHFHMNDNWKFWDDDMIVGSIHSIEFVELFWWLRQLDYNGFISTDQYPYREDGRDAVNESVKYMRLFEKIANTIDDAKLKEILASHDAVASTDFMRKVMFPSFI